MRVAAERTGQRLDGVHALRGVAALSILYYHYTGLYDRAHGGHAAPGVSFSLPVGIFKVELFYVISGFLIGMALERARGPGSFLGARFIRLYPSFLVALAWTVAVTAVLGDPVPFVGAGRLIGNLTMAPALFGVAPADPSYWTLQYELLFYLAAAATLAPARRRPPEVWCGIWMALAIAARMVGPDRIPELAIQFAAIPFAQYFAIGVMLRRVHTGQASRWTWTLLTLALAMTLGGPPHAEMDPLPRPLYSVMVAAFALLLLWAARSGDWGKWGALPRWLGRVSYPLYLVHQAAGHAVIARLEATGLAPDLAVAAAVALSVLVAWTIAGLIDAPARGWLRARFRSVSMSRPGMAVSG